jgi:hypothetical protein
MKKNLKKYKAFTLVELVVAIFITSLVAVTLFNLYDRSAKDFFQVQDTSDLQSEANILFATIEKDLAKGGFVHPARGDISNAANCRDGITAANAVNIVSGTEVSACFDIPNFDGSVIYRYKITYRKGTFTGGPDANTLYKKVERTDDCSTVITSESNNDNLDSIIHGWQPVSDKVGNITFSYPSIGGSTNDNSLDVDILFTANSGNPVSINFNKRVFLRNKNLTGNSTQCDDKCPNAKDLFVNYDVSDDDMIWDPSSNNVPSARVAITTNYVEDEDSFSWDTTMATSLSLTVDFNEDVGVLEIDGTATAQEYQDFLRTVRYVNLVDDQDDRTTVSGDDRSIQLALGMPGLCADLIPREVGGVRHFYCYTQDTTSGRGALNGGGSGATMEGNTLWWGQAELRAEASRYYNLMGYLATITSEAENNYILDKIRDGEGNPIAAWFGGSDMRDTTDSGGNNFTGTEGVWRWVGGPEEGNIFFTTSTTDGIPDGWTSWRTGEPNDCCDDIHGVTYDNTSLETNEHYPAESGEHYTQFSNNQNGGWWNDLFLPGVTYSPFTTLGYALEFSSNFAEQQLCSNATTANQRACVNYWAEFGVVIDDTTYQDPNMLDICLPDV